MSLLCSALDHAVVPPARSPAGLAEGTRQMVAHAAAEAAALPRRRRARHRATSATDSTSHGDVAAGPAKTSVAQLRAGRIRRAARARGCGKSTLLRLVAGLEPATTGRMLAGRRARSRGPTRRASSCSRIRRSIPGAGLGQCRAGPGGARAAEGAARSASTRRSALVGLRRSPRPFRTSSRAAWRSAWR